MRHLLANDIEAELRNSKSVEQFLGRSPVDAGHIRHIELRPADGGIEVWVFDVEDMGSEDCLDIYAFPYFDPDGPDGPVASFPDAQAAVEHACASLAAYPARWTNEGVAQSEYLDYIRAGRPSTWPVVA